MKKKSTSIRENTQFFSTFISIATRIDKTFPFVFAFLLLAATTLAQTTVTINCTGGANNSGYVNSSGTKTDGNLIVDNTSPARRGWAHFNLSSIPAGSYVTSASLKFTVTSNNAASGVTNNIYGFTGTPTTISALAGATLYSNAGSGTSFISSTWTQNAVNTLTLNATGLSFLAANLGTNNVNMGLVRGAGSSVFNISGYPAAAASQPQLVITYVLSNKVQFSAFNAGSPSGWCLGETRNVSLTVTNTGSSTWISGGAGVNLSYWWSNQGTPAGNIATARDINPRQNLFMAGINEVAPGQTRVLTIPVNAPTAAGTLTLNFDLVKDGSCWFADNTANCSGPGNTVFTSGSITVNQPPAISTQPTGQTACSNPGTASFSITATGSSLAYQWRLNGVNLSNGVQGDGSAVSGATTATLSLSALTSNNTVVAASGYDCVVTGSATCGSVTSTRVPLTINSSPIITTQPVTATSCNPPGTADYTVAASGAGITYRWRLNGVNLNDGVQGNGSTLTGTTSSNLNLSTLTNANTVAAASGYDCIVTTAGPCVITSSRVALTVSTQPVIVTQPTNQTACSTPGTASFTLAATGTGLIYQWRLNGVSLSNGNQANGSTVAGANTNTLNLSILNSSHTAEDESGYDCIVSGTTPCGPVTSTRVALTVNSSPVINSQPTAQTVCNPPGTASYSVAASGTGLVYQWRLNGVNLNNGGQGNGTTVSGANTNTLSLSTLTSSHTVVAASGYDCLITATGPCALTSARVALTVSNTPIIGTHPNAQTSCSTPGTANFAVAATGSGLTYRWRLNGVNLNNGAQGNGSTVAGATTNTLTLSLLNGSHTVMATSGYDCVVSGTAPCASATSNRVALTVNTLPVIGTQPTVQTACSLPGIASFEIAATGTGITYRWRLNGVNINDGVQSNGSTITGAATNTLSLSDLTADNTVSASSGYDCVVSGTSPCAAVTSTRVALTVNNAPTGSSIPICQNASGSLTSNTSCLPSAPVTSGPRAAAAGANINSGGTAWTNPARLIADDNSNVTYGFSAGGIGTSSGTSQTLSATQYGFAIPNGATITGVVVTIGRNQSGGGGSVQDNFVQLVKGGTVGGTNLGLTSTDWPGSETAQSYGSATNLSVWGSTFTPAEINAANFGAALKVDVSTNFFQTRTANVDYIQISVSYTLPGSLNWYTASSNGVLAGSGSSLNVPNPGLTSTATAGSTTFYVECSTAPGCRGPVDFIINTVPSFNLTDNHPFVTRGTTSVEIPYNDVSENPDLYSLTWTSPGIGFTNVNNSVLPVSPFTLTFPNTADAVTHNGNITVTNSTTGCTSLNNPFSVTITPLPITIDGVTVDDKTYDGTTAATLSGTPSYIGLINGENLSVSGMPVANFIDASTGENKSVIISGYTAPNTNYTLASQPTATADITPVALTVTAENKSKNYDGNIYSGGYTSLITGFVNGENAAVVSGTVSYTGAAVSATAAGNHTITPVVSALSASNYSFSSVNGTLTINPASQTFADFRSKADGSLSTVATWEYNGGGGTWFNATQKPGVGNNVEILHNVLFDESFVAGSTKTLKVTSGTANFNNQSVTFTSDASGTASLGEIAGTVINATNVTVERYIPNNGFRSWRLLSVPVATTQSIRQAWQEGDANPLPKQNNLPGRGTHITGVFASQALAAAAGFDSITPQPGMQYWAGAAWGNITSTTQPINNYPAYFLFIRGNRGGNIAGSSSAATTLRTTGTVFTGDQVTNIGASAFAVVANVYPSAINFTGLERTGGVSNLFYIWDSKKLNGTSLGMYQTFSSTNSFNALIAGGSYVQGQPNTTIESGQAFFVKSTTAGSITLKETAKVSSSGSLGFRPSPSAISSKLDTRLYNSAEEMLDANTVVFDAVYSKAVAAEDAPKLGNPGWNFAIEMEGTLLAVEGTVPVKENEVIQYRMWNMQAGTYRLELQATNLHVPAGTTAVLEDSYLQTATELNATGSTDVHFTVDQNPASSSANRFRVVFAKGKAAAESKQGYTIAPNPVETGVMNVVFANKAEGRYSVRILGSNGQSAAVRTIVHNGGTANQAISLPATMGSGTYTVEIIAPDKSRTTTIVLVNRK